VGSGVSMDVYSRWLPLAFFMRRLERREFRQQPNHFLLVILPDIYHGLSYHPRYLLDVAIFTLSVDTIHRCGHG
jgi:hypothetical protein